MCYGGMETAKKTYRVTLPTVQLTFPSAAIQAVMSPDGQQLQTVLAMSWVACSDTRSTGALKMLKHL